MRGAILTFFLAFAFHGADAQSNRPDEIAVKSAVVVYGHIEMVIGRLGTCVDLDRVNATSYLVIVTEYLRDKNIGTTISKTEKLFETEVR